MTVGYLPTFGATPIGFIRRAVHIETVGIETLHHIGQQLTEQYIIATVHFGKSLGSVFVLPSPVANSFVNLIITTPHGQRRMSAQTLYIIFSLSLYTFQEQRVVRVSGTSEQKILPYQDTVAVGLIVELIVFVYTASPHT